MPTRSTKLLIPTICRECTAHTTIEPGQAKLCEPCTEEKVAKLRKEIDEESALCDLWGQKNGSPHLRALQAELKALVDS